jgi:hypothetical protein
MPRSVNQPRLSQPTLFHPLHPRPPFHTFPQDIQEKTIRLLARLLRLQADQTLAPDRTQEATFRSARYDTVCHDIGVASLKTTQSVLNCTPRRGNGGIGL